MLQSDASHSEARGKKAAARTTDGQVGLEMSRAASTSTRRLRNRPSSIRWSSSHKDCSLIERRSGRMRRDEAMLSHDAAHSNGMMQKTRG